MHRTRQFLLNGEGSLVALLIVMAFLFYHMIVGAPMSVHGFGLIALLLVALYHACGTKLHAVEKELAENIQGRIRSEEREAANRDSHEVRMAEAITENTRLRTELDSMENMTMMLNASALRTQISNQEKLLEAYVKFDEQMQGRLQEIARLTRLLKHRDRMRH